MSKLLTAFGDGIGSSSRDVPESDFAAMDGGSFYIGAGNRDKLIGILTKLQADGDHKLALVPTTGEITIFFADIDHVPPKFNLQKFLEVCVACINDIVPSGVDGMITAGDVIVFKREVTEESPRFHIYVTKMMGKSIRKAIEYVILK